VRTTTLNSYLYKEYEDDDDLQALVAAYNGATQAHVDWFNQVGLPYYPGLTGPLLDWVAQGLYGLLRNSLASPFSPALGPPNTVAPNTTVPNGYTPSSQTFYSLSDDVFKRILTWDFFKGDGKRFSIRWLKRRIIRFILGTNGIDPQPSQPGFVIGTESTQAIGVLISTSTNICTVSINQTLLSALVQLSPGILTLFKLAFEGGALDLPVQYTYVCNIVTALTAVMSPNTETVTSSAFAQTTGISTVLVTGGTSSYTYVWTWQSGGAGITINSPAAAGTSFSASGMSWGQTFSGVALCTVTDMVSSLTATATCFVTINCAPPPSLLAENGNWLTTESGIPIVLEAGGASGGSFAPGQLSFNLPAESGHIPLAAFGWA
jgi:hypothetical protein